jgi:hypothetical protein
MALDITSILNAVISHAMATGRFLAVNGHQSKQSPSNGITASVWVEKVTPVTTSGLNSVSTRIELTVRMYSSTTSEPYDDIDPNLTACLDDLLSAYCGDFELGGLIRHVDIFGAHGNPLESRAGYMNLDGKEFRVFSVRLPLIVNDLWTEAP